MKTGRFAEVPLELYSPPEFLVPGKGMCFLYVNEPGILMAFRRFFGGFSKDEVYSEEESREILRMIAQGKM